MKTEIKGEIVWTLSHLRFHNNRWRKMPELHALGFHSPILLPHRAEKESDRVHNLRAATLSFLSLSWVTESGHLWDWDPRAECWQGEGWGGRQTIYKQRSHCRKAEAWERNQREKKCYFYQVWNWQKKKKNSLSNGKYPKSNYHPPKRPFSPTL